MSGSDGEPKGPACVGRPGRAGLAQWFTAGPVTALAFAATTPAPSERVLDPTCGDGAFLVAAQVAGITSISGVEIDPATATRARGRVPLAEITIADVLAPGLVAQLGMFDLVVGNPPYVRAGRVAMQDRHLRAAVMATDFPDLGRALVDTIARHADVAATCIVRALRFVRPGGQLALVVSTALLDADGAAALWTAIDQLAEVRALIVAPTERWFADAAVNSMLLVARRRCAGDSPRVRQPLLVRLTAPTVAIATVARGLGDLARRSEVRVATERTPGAWATALRAPAAWFAWRAAAGDRLVPLRELADVRRGLTTGANRVFYLRREQAQARQLERKYLAPVVRSPFNGSPATIAIAPHESPLVAIALPPDAKLARLPRIAAWLAEHEPTALATSAARREPWWSLPANPARLFLAKAYGPRFVQRLADVPMLGDQRVYAVTPRPGIDLVALAAVLNALPTTVALEAHGRGSLGYGAIEHTVNDALALPVLDVRRADSSQLVALAAAVLAMSRRPIEHLRVERMKADRALLDTAALALAPGHELATQLWDDLLASVALRDRYLLPSVGHGGPRRP